jgi:hypothetical protein
MDRIEPDTFENLDTPEKGEIATWKWIDIEHPCI